MNEAFRNFVTGKAGLTGISGAATTYSTGSAGFNFCIDGKAYTKTQVSGGTTPTTDAKSGAAITLTANKGCVVVWTVNSGGTVAVYKGDTEDLDPDGDFKFAPEFPWVPDTVVPFAYTLHKAGSTTSGTWTFGSSNWNAAGLTHVVQDVMKLPSRPQAS
jgi:hypothetical protein